MRCSRCREMHEHEIGDIPFVCNSCKESDKDNYEKIREILKNNSSGLSPTEVGELAGIPATKVLSLMKAFAH